MLLALTVLLLRDPLGKISIVAVLVIMPFQRYALRLFGRVVASTMPGPSLMAGFSLNQPFFR